MLVLNTFCFLCIHSCRQGKGAIQEMKKSNFGRPRCFGFLPIAALAILLAAIVVPSRADSIVAIDMSNISFTGNHVCGGICKDTFNATWDWDATTKSVVPGSVNVSNSGPLGNLSLTYVTSYSFQFNSTSLPDYDAITWYFGSNFPASGTYDLSEAYLYCGGGVCAADFGSGYSDPKSGKITVAPVLSPVPEPSSISLLGLGILALGSLAWWKSRSKQSNAALGGAGLLSTFTSGSFFRQGRSGFGPVSLS